MAGPRALSPQQVARVAHGLAQERPWRREFRRAYRPVGTFVIQAARALMRSSGDARLADAARALRSAPTPTAAVIGLGRTQVDHALATIYGTKGRSGRNLMSYTRPAPGTPVRIRALGEASKLQHPEWVGNDWTAATPGEGPRGLNDAAAQNIDEIGDKFLDATLDVVIRAFPSGSIT